MKLNVGLWSLILSTGAGFAVGIGISALNSSAVRMPLMLAQITSCWLTIGNQVSTTCNVTSSSTMGVAGSVPGPNVRLAVGGRISSAVLGTYCGGSASNTTGNVGGYPAAKSICENACGNANAHLCSAHEISISKQLGASIPNGQYYDSHISTDVNGGNPMRDCNGWMSGTAAVYANTTGLGSVACNTSAKLSCCL